MVLGDWKFLFLFYVFCYLFVAVLMGGGIVVFADETASDVLAKEKKEML